MITSDYLVTATIVYPEPGENYTERFTMNGTGADDVRYRARVLLGDPRYLIAVRKA